MPQLVRYRGQHASAEFSVRSDLVCTGDAFNLDNLVRKESFQRDYQLNGQLEVYFAGGLHSPVSAARVPITAELKEGVSPNVKNRTKVDDKWQDQKKVNRDYTRPQLNVSLDYSSLADRCTEEGREVLEELADKIEDWQSSHPDTLGRIVSMYEQCMKGELTDKFLDLNQDDRTQVNTFMVLTAITSKLSWGKYNQRTNPSAIKDEQLKEKATEDGVQYHLENHYKISHQIADLSYLAMRNNSQGNKVKDKLSPPVLSNLTRQERKPGVVTITTGDKR